MKKILILSSNPRRDLNLEREVGDLITAVQRLGKFEVRLRLAVRPEELQLQLLEYKPEIVHFCGHGAGEQGLVLQDENGREQFVSTESLSGLFKIFSNDIDCVVLNACDSDCQAEVIVAHINYVVGMNQEILDKAAYIFAVGFYQGLGFGKSIEQAYELGCNAIQLQLFDTINSRANNSNTYRKLGHVDLNTQTTLPEHLKPILRKKSTLPSSPSVVSSTEAVHPSASSTSPNLPPDFVEVIEQEIERKDYKDKAREAYDNFGLLSAANVTSFTKEHKQQQRKIVLSKVKEFWIEGFLKPSLQGNAVISLDLKARPDAIYDLSHGIEALSVELDESFEELRTTRIYEEMGQGRTLLILGNPGGGKTIALLQLAQRLVERSEQDLSLPIPVVFNLSSWGKDRKPIVDWLIDELREKYQVPQSLSELWIKQQQLILLLDGLDEVKKDYRNDCVKALNQFIISYPFTEIAVCSRVRDYEELEVHLKISIAICLQPLSSEQVHEYLDKAGNNLEGLKLLLKRDIKISILAQTPLILNLMIQAYRGWSVEDLRNAILNEDENLTKKHLFDTYIKFKFKQKTSSEYLEKEVRRWLSWLAAQMVKEKQTIFFIEKMQPSCLANRSEIRIYQISKAIFISPIMALLLGSMLGMIFFPMLISALLVNKENMILKENIILVEHVNWSWKIKFFLVGFLIFLLINLLTISMFGRLIPDKVNLINFNLLIDGLIGCLWLGLISGVNLINFTEVNQRTIPNQGIWTSARNGLISELIFVLVFGRFGWQAGQNINSPIRTLGMMLGLGLLYGLKMGGVACIQHFNLRLILHHKKRIPWNYARFLDFASERYLLRKVGGGYIFFHRMLMEHFARMESD